MKETLHFRVESAQNFALLYMTVMYEKRPMTRISEKSLTAFGMNAFIEKTANSLCWNL